MQRLNSESYMKLNIGYLQHLVIIRKKSVDYILSTTREHKNEWVTVKVNVKEHFKKFHDLDVNEINGIAIMTDTDNSKLTAIAYYQNINFTAN